LHLLEFDRVRVELIPSRLTKVSKMNAIDILGSLLGAGRPSAGRSGGDGGAADILGELLGGGKRDSRSGQPSDAQVSAKELEEMMGVGQAQAPVGRTSPTQPPSRSAPPPQSAPSSGRSGFPTDIFGQRQSSEPKVNIAVAKPALPSQNDQAVLLIRSMINSAKVDGEISEEEQQAILGQVGDTSPETIKFLRAEFARPINLAEFAGSIPIGMEHKAYGIALMAIKLDSREEADYLRQLASLLRISPEECNQLHQQQNAPLLFQ
jgi:hypothetical protein